VEPSPSAVFEWPRGRRAEAGAQAINLGPHWRGGRGLQFGEPEPQPIFRGMRSEGELSPHVRYFMWPPRRVTLPKRNSCATLAPMRSAVAIAKFPKTKPAPRFEFG
jgi:hypothetical protein